MAPQLTVTQSLNSITITDPLILVNPCWIYLILRTSEKIWWFQDLSPSLICNLAATGISLCHFKKICLRNTYGHFWRGWLKFQSASGVSFSRSELEVLNDFSFTSHMHRNVAGMQHRPTVVHPSTRTCIYKGPLRLLFLSTTLSENEALIIRSS